jgi:hypothetical protein
VKVRRLFIGLILFLLGCAAGGLAVHVWHDGLAGWRERPPPRRWEATIYLPVQSNEGHRFSETELNPAIAILVKEFGGATQGAEQRGCWLDREGQVRCELIRPVVVSFEPGRLEAFRTAVRDVGALLRQQEMYVRFEEPRVELIPVPGS